MTAVEVPGAPDFQLQNAQTTQLITTCHYVEDGTVKTFDIAALLQPHYVGLMYLYVQSSGTAGNTIVVQTQYSNAPPSLIPLTRLGNGEQSIRPLVAAGVVQAAQPLSVFISPDAGSSLNSVGDLFVFGLTLLPIVNEWSRPGKVWQLIQGDRTAVGAGVTQTVLARPANGFYYRVKSLTARANAAPAAAAAMAFSTTLGAIAIARYTTQAVANDSFNWSGDFWCDDGIDFTNGSAVGWRAEATAELWPLG